MMWRSLRVAPREFSLHNTFSNGQCWCWRKVNDQNHTVSKEKTSSTATMEEDNDDDGADDSSSAAMWCGVVGSNVYLLRQLANDVEYTVLNTSTTQDTKHSSSSSSHQKQVQDQEDHELRSFLQLETNMSVLKDRWCASEDGSPPLEIHQDMKILVSSLPGMRVLRQDPFECLFSFMASANNNISRISHILSYWRVKWGTHLLTTNKLHNHIYTPQNDPTYQEDLNTFVSTFHFKSSKENTENKSLLEKDKVHYFSFPKLDILNTLNEHDFLAFDDDGIKTGCGLGYRAKTTVATLQLLTKLGGRNYLLHLRSSHSKDSNDSNDSNDSKAPKSSHSDPKLSLLDVRTSLMQFPGVGPKVADCVRLFSLDEPSVVPADVHICNIAERDFGKTKLYRSCTSKTLTVQKRAVINECFVSAFGTYAGWAHCLLFAAELLQFQKDLPYELVEKRIIFKRQQKELKRKMKEEKKNMKQEKEVNRKEEMAGSPEKKRKVKKEEETGTPSVKPNSTTKTKTSTSKYFKKK